MIVELFRDEQCVRREWVRPGGAVYVRGRFTVSRGTATIMPGKRPVQGGDVIDCRSSSVAIFPQTDTFLMELP